RNQIVIAERYPAFGEQDLVVPRRANFFYDVADVPWREKLPFLYVRNFSLLSNRNNEVRLSAEKRGDLENVSDRLDRCHLFPLVNVRQHRHSDFFLYLGENFQPFLQTRSAVGILGRAIRLVIRRLEDVGHADAIRRLFELRCVLQGGIAAFDHAGSGDDGERLSRSDLDASYRDLFRDHTRTKIDWNGLRGAQP